MASSNPGCAFICTDIHFEVDDVDPDTGNATVRVLEFTCSSGGLPGGNTSGVEVFPKEEAPFYVGMRGWAKLVQDTAGVDCHWRAYLVGEALTTIRFVIVDPLVSPGGSCSALAYVVSRPFGMSTVPEEYGGTVVVEDMAGCFLCHPAEDLVGRGGYASYMDASPTTDGSPAGDVMPPETRACPGTPTPRWEIIALCRRDPRC